MSDAPDGETIHRIKRKRVSHACNLCRSRKVRCDEQMPTCGNCQRAGAVCVTTDPRNPEVPVTSRRKSALPETSALVRPSQHGDETEIAHQLLAMEQTIRGRPRQGTHSVTLATSPTQRNSMCDHSRPVSSENLRLSGQAPGNESAGLMINGGVNDGSKRKYMGASSFHVLAQWLGLSFSASGMEKPSAHFRFGMTGTEEVSLPLSMMLPQLPPLSERDSCISAFFSRIHPMFPLLNEVSFRNTVNRLADADLNSPSPSDRPLLACVYGVISIGADERAGTTENGTKYFTAAFSLYAHLVAYPYRSSVQAILILVLALRGRNKDSLAWDVHGQAVRLAQSIGLHRKVLCVHASDDVELNSRVW